MKKRKSNEEIAEAVNSTKASITDLRHRLGPQRGGSRIHHKNTRIPRSKTKAPDSKELDYIITKQLGKYCGQEIIDSLG